MSTVRAMGTALVRVATWNLWWRFGPWEERQGPIAQEIERVNADIFCLQEVWSDDEGDQAELLARSSGLEMARTRADGGTPHRFGNAVLSRWPIVSHHTVALPGMDGEPSHRSALFAAIDVPDSSLSWWVVCTHLEWRYSATELRQRQLQAIIEECERLRSGAGEVIFVLAGDFNAVADSDEIRRLTGLSQPYGTDPAHERMVFTDAWAAVSDASGHTWSRANPHSANAQWPRRRLDAVFISWPRPKPTGNPLTAELFGVEGPVVPSDHYGVVVELDRRATVDSETT